MNKGTAFISIVAYCLMIISYTLGFVEEYNLLIGLLMTTIVVIIVLIARKYVSKIKTSDSMEESDSQSEIGVKIKGEKVLFEDIEQTSDSKKKAIGRDIEAKEVTFRKIRQ